MHNIKLSDNIAIPRTRRGIYSEISKLDVFTHSTKNGIKTFVVDGRYGSIYERKYGSAAEGQRGHEYITKRLREEKFSIRQVDRRPVLVLDVDF